MKTVFVTIISNNESLDFILCRKCYGSSFLPKISHGEVTLIARDLIDGVGLCELCGFNHIKNTTRKLKPKKNREAAAKPPSARIDTSLKQGCAHDKKSRT